MKQFFSFVSILTIALALQFSLLSQQAIAQDDSAVKPGTTEGGKSPCGYAPGDSATVDPSQEIDGVIVLLSESIADNPTGFSCSQIINCLRDYYEGPNSEIGVMIEVRRKYSYCMISGKDGLDLLNVYAGLVYRWLAGIVGAICVLIIIISGIQISIGGLSQEEVSSAKDRIYRSLIGLVVLFLSAFILYTINPIFFFTP